MDVTNSTDISEDYIGETEQSLPEEAVPLWRITDGFQSLFYWLIPLIYAVFAEESGWPEWGVYLLAGVVVLYTILRIVWIPDVRWRHWSYAITEQEVILNYGVFVLKKVQIPIKRVQHVDTRQGPVHRYFGLSNVAVTTAATTHHIPALKEDRADEIRNRISNFARLAIEDV